MLVYSGSSQFICLYSITILYSITSGITSSIFFHIRLVLFTDYALEFPNKGVTDFVHFWGMPRLAQFTVCFWMKSSDSSDGTPLSYAVKEADNELVIAKYNNFSVWIGDEKR